jgi:hypothetical protein
MSNAPLASQQCSYLPVQSALYDCVLYNVTVLHCVDTTAISVYAVRQASMCERSTSKRGIRSKTVLLLTALCTNVMTFWNTPADNQSRTVMRVSIVPHTNAYKCATLAVDRRGTKRAVAQPKPLRTSNSSKHVHHGDIIVIAQYMMLRTSSTRLSTPLPCLEGIVMSSMFSLCKSVTCAAVDKCNGRRSEQADAMYSSCCVSRTQIVINASTMTQ